MCKNILLTCCYGLTQTFITYPVEHRKVLHTKKAKPRILNNKQLLTTV